MLTFPGCFLFLHPGILLVHGHHGQRRHSSHSHIVQLRVVGGVTWNRVRESFQYLNKCK